MKSILLIILTIGIVNSQTCISQIPTTDGDCTGIKSDSEYCCYLSAPNLTGTLAGLAKKCYNLPKTAFNGDPTISYNGYSYFINCGVQVTKTALPACGPTGAAGRKDCMTGATFTNSCCWDLDNKNCVWMGTKYTGTTKWAGLNLDCSAADLSVSLMILFAILSIIF
jgi:hypothetical protein